MNSMKKRDLEKLAIKTGTVLFDTSSTALWLMLEGEQYIHFWLIEKRSRRYRWINDKAQFIDSGTKTIEVLTPLGLCECYSLHNRNWGIKLGGLNRTKYHTLKMPMVHDSK